MASANTTRNQSSTNFSFQSSSFNSSTGKEALQQHVETFNKLCLENKINAKNAWHIKIQSICKWIVFKKDEDDNVLLNVANSLDGSAKVYAYRVDDVHNKCLSLATKLTSEEGKRQNNEENNDSDQDTTLSTTTKTKRAGRKLKKKSTIVQNINDVLAPVSKLETSLNLLKESTEISASEGLVSYLFSGFIENSLSLDTNKIPFFKRDEPEANKNIIKITENEGIFEIPLCEAFDSFSLCNWNLDDTDTTSRLSLENPLLITDENGIPLPELDGTIVDIFQDHDEHPEPINDDEEPENDYEFKLQEGYLQIVDTLPAQSLEETEYGYKTVFLNAEGQELNRFWAGPDYWKYKQNRKPTPAIFTGCKAANEQQKVRKPKNTPINYDLKHTFDPDCELPVPRKRGTANSDKLTLPAYSNHFQTGVNQLLTKPVSFVNDKKLASGDTKCDVEPFNYDNLNDSEYCPQNNEHDGASSDDNEAPFSVIEENVEAQAPANFVEENLVSAPECVSICKMNYAVRAKKINIKDLKKLIWGKVQPIYAQGEINFSELYKFLKTALSTELSQELTPHVGIVALLHLCNEKNLMLFSKGLTNFSIRKFYAD